MCEITRKWMGIEYDNGLVYGIAQGMGQGITKTIINQLTKNLGSILEYIINKINDSNEEDLDQLLLNIFDIDKEEDILKYIY